MYVCIYIYEKGQAASKHLFAKIDLHGGERHIEKERRRQGREGKVKEERRRKGEENSICHLSPV